MELQLKSFTPGDIEFSVAQAAREGWATGRAFFERHLEHDPAGAWIAWLSGRRVGLVTAAGYESTGWVGNLIVEPDCRSRGIGRRLMERAISYLESTGLATLRLDADPPGVPLYRSLGFVEESKSLRYRWTGSGGGHEAGVASSATDARVIPLGAEDLPEMLRLDRRSFGDRRDRLLPIILKQAGSALGVREQGRLRGFLIALSSTAGIRIGPFTAENHFAAESLLNAIMHRHPDGPLILGLPDMNRPGVELLESLGFEATPPCLRMVRGIGAAAGEAKLCFAIAGGDVG